MPRWRVTQWLVHAGTNVPLDIRAALIKSLYGTLPIFAGGVINSIAVSALVATRIPDPPFLGWLIFEIILCAARLALLLTAHRAAARGRRTPTDIYILLSVLWAFSVGYGTFICILSGDWVSATLSCLSAAAMVGGICFRNFGAPRLVAVMILLSLGPSAIASIFSGELVLLIVALQIPFYLISMTMASYRLNAMLVSTMMAERENDYRARHDPLTGLPNRSGLMAALTERLSSARPEKEGLTLFYLDLDGFKGVNDRHGHAAGDALLRQVAARLRTVAEPGDVIARMGGDEFVIISAIGDRSASRLFAERIILEIANGRYSVGDDMVHVGVSVGIALGADHGTDVATLLDAADQALYAAKASGPCRCALAPAHWLPEKDRGAQAKAVSAI